MGDQTQAYDIFQTPLSSGYPLPLKASIQYYSILQNMTMELFFRKTYC